MQRGIFAYILAYSLRQQVVLLLLTVAALPFYYLSLDLPKRIINQAVDPPPDKFPRTMTLFGQEIASLGQLELLGGLCGLFLVLVLVNGAFKYAINVYKGLLGERMLRRLRFQLHERLLRFTPQRLRHVSQGEMVAVIGSEVEPLGGFIGDAFATPLYQGGLLVTGFVFILIQDPLMGLAVVALYPVQAVVIPRLQAQVNQLGKARVREMRQVSNLVAETLATARDVRLEGAERYASARFADRLGRIFEIRYQIYRKKFFIKFLNNFLAQLTPFFFFLIGGYMVIRGDLTLGALVAVLAAYKDLAPPWKELLDYYQSQQDARIRYEQILVQFHGGVVETASAHAPVAPGAPPRLAVRATSLVQTDGHDGAITDASFAIAPGEHVAILGDGRSGKDALARLLAGIELPSAGEITIEGYPTDAMPAPMRAREIGFVDATPAFQAGSVLDALLLGLRRQPDRASLDSRAIMEAEASGNSLDDITADWIDYAAADVADRTELIEEIVRLARALDLEDTLYDLGLRAIIDPDSKPELALRLLEARRAFTTRLGADDLRDLVELFDPAAFNAHLSVGGNIVFGDADLLATDPARLIDVPSVRRFLRQAELDDDLLRIGHRLAVVTAAAETEDLPIHPEERVRLEVIAALTEDGGTEKLSRRDRRLLQGLALRLIADRHEAVDIDDMARARIISARAKLATSQRRLLDDLHLFTRSDYSPALTVRENIIFGEPAPGVPGAVDEINRALRQQLDALGMCGDIVRAGLSFDIGAGGSFLSASLRPRIAILRALIKRPRLLILADATIGLDPGAAGTLMTGLRAECDGRTLIVLTGDKALATTFPRVIEIENGRVRSESQKA